ncbi:MAG: bifunctional nuclease family protein [Thermoflexales bacterium]|nr:bifunctional nuclease family protein [Thermoflexales bacterium]
MVEVKVEAIRVNLMGSFRAVILKDTASGRSLAIYIGQPEADAIAIQLTGVQVPRPLTHDLIVSILKALGVTVRYVVVNELRNDTYYARIILKTKDAKELSIDSRPSDAIAIAVRIGCPIYVDEDIMLQHGQLPEPEEVEAAESSSEEEEDLGAFSDFLKSLDLDDLDKDKDK